jgi:D-apiose dehydrogenase
MTHRKGLLIGAGYFAHFHLDAWQRIPNAEITCVCDSDVAKAELAAKKFSIPQACATVAEAWKSQEFDFVDVVTPSTDRLELIESLLEYQRPIICQKPLAPTFAEADHLLSLVEASGVPFMVHENFRFQPWYREIRRLIQAGLIGRHLHSIFMRTRMGDGWGPNAYLGRQPYFRTMPRLLIHETGIHIVDSFRFLAGEICSCYASLRRLNPVIVGEDDAHICFEFESGARGVWDASRYNESRWDDPRYTFGELCVEADQGSLWLDTDGTITIKLLGQPPQRHEYAQSRAGFAGDCIRTTQMHFLDVLDGVATCETSPNEYRKSLRVVEAIYDAAQSHKNVSLRRAGRRVVDLSHPLSTLPPVFSKTPCKTRDVDGWNATTISNLRSDYKLSEPR